MDLPFLLYGLGLAAATVVASLTVTVHPDWRLAWGALAVVGNWVAGTVFALVTGVTDGWWFNIAIDLLAAGAVFYRAATRWQVALGAAYSLQIVLHLYYAWKTSQGMALPWAYYGALTAIAWLQLLIIFAWSADIWLRRGPRRFGNAQEMSGRTPRRS